VDEIVYQMFRDLLIIVLAIATLFVTSFGVLIYGLLSRRLKMVARGEAEEEMLKQRAYSLATIGYSYWHNYRNSKNPEYLKLAIALTERALSECHKLKKEDEALICMIKNNLAYYLAEDGRLEYRQKALEYAKYIYDRIDKYPSAKAQWLDTYNYVRQRFPD
jgi:hypothetical protein